MKNLDSVNPDVAKPGRILPLGALLPFLVGGMTWMLASGASKEVPLYQDFPSLLCMLVMTIAIAIGIIAKLARWDWQTKYFGVGSFYMGSFSLFGIVPWLCIVIYGNIPMWEKILLFLVYVGVVVWWCSRFISIYREIMSNDANLRLIYEEDGDAIYYLQKNDGWLLQKRFGFEQSPHYALYIVMLILGFASLIFGDASYRIMGAPGIYTFCLFCFFPFVLLTLGLAVRGCLVYYYFPIRLKNKTGKKTYVDMGSKSFR